MDLKPQPALHATLVAVTERIAARSSTLRQQYLERVRQAAKAPPGRQRMGCANLAHAVAAMPVKDQLRIVSERRPHLAVVTAYNDMLSAHAPYERYPHMVREEVARLGATVQVAGGVPAMCDGITQGEPGMELSLFSRDAIAMATAVALSHDVFDGALLLGVCDKIVPGLLIGALHFGHLPCVFVPAGPMSTGISNAEKSHVREQHAQGLASREALQKAESAAYHGPGTCTFYGTANSNQMLLEAMGLHLPGAAFAAATGSLREALTRSSVGMLLQRTQQPAAGIGEMVDERCIVNAMVALLATGGSTNHLIHWVAVARAAGVLIDWDDFSALSAAVPLLARVYPNGHADVNDFEAAGGPAFVLRELLQAGLLHGDVDTVNGRGLARQTNRPRLVPGETLSWEPCQAESGDETVLRSAAAPFQASGGLKLLQGNLGRSVIKVSAVPQAHQVVRAPARVFHSQAQFQAAFQAGELARDVVVVLRFQGPKANGMPELHKLTPGLSVLQGQGFKVALVTDGRMSGASGKVPAAIHVSPEAAAGGSLARVRDGDEIELNAITGTLQVHVAPDEWMQRAHAELEPQLAQDSQHGMGRELFAGMRRNVLGAEQGACTWV